MDIQALFKTIADASRVTRKSYHVTLKKLIETIESLVDRSIPVVFDYDQTLSTNSVHSYRGYYDDLALNPTDKTVTADELLTVLTAAHGAEFTGWKGGEFRMDGDTPLWVAEPGRMGPAVIDVTFADNKLILITKEID